MDMSPPVLQVQPLPPRERGRCEGWLAPSTPFFSQSVQALSNLRVCMMRLNSAWVISLPVYQPLPSISGACTTSSWGHSPALRASCSSLASTTSLCLRDFQAARVGVQGVLVRVKSASEARKAFFNKPAPAVTSNGWSRHLTRLCCLWSSVTRVQ
jgi:hypothetical protein